MRSHDHGWSRALDIQMDYHKWCSSDGGTLFNIIYFKDTLEKVSSRAPAIPEEPGIIDAAAVQLNKHLVQTLYQADTMFVTSDMLHVLMQAAADLPEDAAFDEKILITPCGFCLFEEPIIGDDGDGNVAVNGIAWKVIMGAMTGDTEIDKMLMIYFLVDPDDTRDDFNGEFNNRMREAGISATPLTLQHFYPTRFGKTIERESYRSTNGSLIIADTLAVFLAMQLLAQQTIGEPITVDPNRATRKRAHKWDGQDRVITLITLRRKSVKKDDHEPQKVEWSRRWVVKGHWHRYWYSTLGIHKYVYLHEYIKGPEDKPLVVTERRVFNFRR